MELDNQFATAGQILAKRYEVVEKLGTGSNGIVYLVRGLKDGELHAMKVFRAQDLAEQEPRMRFEREALALSHLTHENLVTLHEFGILPDGRPFYVAEYVSGNSLEKILDRDDRLETRRLGKIVLQICDAMEYAHQSGIVHRDLKPGNILLMDIPGYQTESVRIVDFGLVRFTADREDNGRLTQEGTAVGSPAYMSPEQCKGKETDGRSDIYSLGCIMYEMLTGRPPFTAPYPMAIMMKQVSAPVEKPSSLAADLEVNEDLEAVVLKCLEKDPSERYQSMQDLKAALETILQSITPG